MSKPLVIYHGAGCRDGHCAAWTARKFLRTKDDHGQPVETSVEYLPANYGEPPPDVHGRKVYILDFSYPADQLVQLAERNESVLVLDHHATAEKHLAGLSHPKLAVKFSKAKSGAGLAWDHFAGSGTVPWLVKYVEDRDLWRFALTQSKAVNANLRSHPLDFDVWDKLEPIIHSDTKWQQFVKEGEAILRLEKQQVDDATRHAVEVELAGHKVKCVNTTTLISEIAGALAVDRAFGCTFFVGENGVVVSLRSVPGGANVAEIAERFGGGGHQRAAGFTLDSPTCKEFLGGICPTLKEIEDVNKLQRMLESALADAEKRQ